MWVYHALRPSSQAWISGFGFTLWIILWRIHALLAADLAAPEGADRAEAPARTQPAASNSSVSAPSAPPTEPTKTPAMSEGSAPDSSQIRKRTTATK
jgi:hypothetical protein